MILLMNILLLAPSDRLEEMGREGRARVAQCHNIEVGASKLASPLREVLAGGDGIAEL